LAKYQVAGAKDAFIRSKHHFFRNSCRHRPRGGSLVPIVVSFIVSVLPVGFLTSAAILVVKVLVAVAAFVFVVVFLQTFFSFPLFRARLTVPVILAGEEPAPSPLDNPYLPSTCAHTCSHMTRRCADHFQVRHPTRE
jgi:dolichol kinase